MLMIATVVEQSAEEEEWVKEKAKGGGEYDGRMKCLEGDDSGDDSIPPILKLQASVKHVYWQNIFWQWLRK